MNAATASEIARLETMTITKVVERFESLFGEKCRSRNKRYAVSGLGRYELKTIRNWLMR
jgi:hypothetical protein